MDYVELKEGVRVSRFSLGTWAFSGAAIWGENEESDSIRTIRMAVDNGVNLLDTAAAYGDGASEVVLGKAVKGIRDKVMIATKAVAADLAYDRVIASCEASLERLGVDCIDLYQIHWPSRVVPMEETLRAFERLKSDGKVAHMGVCNFGVRCLGGVAGVGVLTDQLPYNILWRQIEHGVTDAAKAADISIWPYCPLGQGLLTGKFKTVEDVPLARRQTRYYSGEWKAGRHSDTGFEKEIFGFLADLGKIADETGYSMAALSLSWLRSRPGVGSVLIGARSEAQLADNLKTFGTVVPTDVLARVSALSDALKPHMGENADMWENADGGRVY